MRHNGTVYSSEFRQQAHQYIIEHSELTQAEIAENLGIPIPTLARWKAKIRQYGYIPVNSKRKPPQNIQKSHESKKTHEKEDTKLEAEIKKLQDEIVVLKKTIHILSQE